MRRLPLHDRAGATRASATVDDDAPTLVFDLRWHLDGDYVATRYRGRKLYLHRLIVGACRGDRSHVDHWNGDPLDNRRANLRHTTPSLNGHNRRRRPPRNVYWHKRKRRWFAKIVLDGRQFLGPYRHTQDEAQRDVGPLRERLGLSDD